MIARTSRAAALAAALASVLALGACGGGGGSSSAGGSSSGAARPKPADPGAAVFASAGCGNCHTLAAAHARGAVGPNLDTLRPSAARVQTQVIHGGGAMPAFGRQLSRAQIRAVAGFVAREAGR